MQERKHEQDAPGQYEGETALHIAIVNRDFDMVKFLIQVRSKQTNNRRGRTRTRVKGRGYL